MPHKLPTSRHKGLLPVRPIRMRSATRWLPCYSMDHRSITSELQPAAPPAALYGHAVVRPRMVVVAALTDVLQRLDVALSSMSVVGHLAMWFTWFTSCCLTRCYIYLFCIAFMRLRIYYVTAYSKSAVMTAVAARSSFFCSFVVSSFIFSSFSIIHLTPAS